jgi:uncharacterized membrane protein
MYKKKIGYVLIAIGVVMTIFFFAANAFGIGDQPGIGWKQTLGASIGIFIVIVGLWLGLGVQEETK